MARFLNKYIQSFATFLFMGLCLPAFLFPLNHFHPENNHTHSRNWMRRFTRPIQLPITIKMLVNSTLFKRI